MGTFDNHRWVSDTLSPLTPSKREDRWDTVMEDFERRLDQIATEYKKSLEDYDYNNELTLELEKSRATIQQLNQVVARERETSEELKKVAEEAKLSEKAFEKERADFLKETASLKTKLKGKVDRNNELTLELETSRATAQELNQLVARERETSEGLQRKMAEVVGQFAIQKRQETFQRHLMRELLREKDQLLSTSEKAKGQFEKEIADLQKQLKEKDDLLTATARENQEMLVDNEGPAHNSTARLEETLHQILARMNESLQTMNAEIQSLKQNQGIVVNSNTPENTEKLHKTIEELNAQIKEKVEKEKMSEELCNMAGQRSQFLLAKLHEKTEQNERQLQLLREKQRLLTTSKHEYDRARRDFEKEIADLKKQLKEKDCAEIQSLRTENKQPGGDTKSNSASFCSNCLVGKTVKLYQYYNSITRDHFYKSNLTELGGLKDGYNFKGVVGHVFQSPVEGAIPLYRYWNESREKHLYSTGWSDVIDLNKMGYVYETISCYVFHSFMEGMRPLVRYYNFDSGDHFLTTDLEEFGEGKNGFVKDRVLGYVF